MYIVLCFVLSFWVSCGVFGAHFALLGVTLASLSLPWDAGGSLWGTLGSQVELGVTLGPKRRSFSDNIWRVCDACA